MNILTLKEAADFLKISHHTLREMAQRKEVPGFKLGGSWRFTLGDLQNHIESLKTQEA